MIEKINQLIKNLRMLKSSNKIPLNQDLKKVHIILEKSKISLVKDLLSDIKNTIRIEELELFNKEGYQNQETPDIEQYNEELDSKISIFN